MISSKAFIAVAVSGGGRSLKNLLSEASKNPWDVALVISSSSTCGANLIAKEFNIPLYIGNFASANLSQVKLELLGVLQKHRIDWIVLAGFLKLFPSFPQYHERVINIHPALLPKFGGKGMHGHHVHQAVIESGDSHSGATVHLGNERYDEGQILSRCKVEVFSEDTPETLAAKVFAAECKLLPLTLTKLIRGELPTNQYQPWELQL